MQILANIFALLIFAPAIANSVVLQCSDNSTLARTRELMTGVRNFSFPELNNTNIQIQLFASESDYFVTRLSVARFLFGQRMAFIIKVNPKVFSEGAPEEGLRAILAHELGHILWLQQQKRIKHLGLIRMATKNYTARFERRTDLLALARGYGDGLASYRRWLYQHIPPHKLAKKQRNYFSPEEIVALQSELKQHPQKLSQWLKNPPLNLAQIKQS